MTTFFRAILASTAFSLALAFSSAAVADVPPPDACSGAAGAACNNAGTNADQPGVCVATMCPHASPTGGGATMIPCTLCEPSSSTTGSSGTTTASSGGAAGSGGSSSGGTTTSSGCAVAVPGQDGLVAFGMLAVGAVALAWHRRRNR